MTALRYIVGDYGGLVVHGYQNLRMKWIATEAIPMTITSQNKINAPAIVRDALSSIFIVVPYGL